MIPVKSTEKGWDLSIWGCGFGILDIGYWILGRFTGIK
jgi:hypothetical protein